MLKKIRHWLFTLGFHLFSGLRSADKKAFGAKDTSDSGDGGNIEVQDEENSVLHDLLRGEVTQEVRELRHEMYYAERESHKYKYTGNGTAVKKNNLYSDNLKSLENSEDLKIILFQYNQEDTGGLSDNLSANDYRLKDHREFTLKIGRNFTPRFRIEEFTEKFVLKAADETHVLIDLYVTKYESQFNRRHRPFLNEIERIYQGDVQSEVISFDTLSFTTYRAYGADDLIEYHFKNIHFENIVEYEGYYVLKFLAEEGEDTSDIVKEFYDDKAAKKFEEHAPRHSGNTLNIMNVTNKVEKKYDVDEAERLLGNLI
jgi:hypothetical protein